MGPPPGLTWRLILFFSTHLFFSPPCCLAAHISKVSNTYPTRKITALNFAARKTRRNDKTLRPTTRRRFTLNFAARKRNKTDQPTTNQPIVELWTFTDEKGAEWAALGPKKSVAQLWIERELGQNISARARPVELPLHSRQTHRRLRQLWLASRLLLCGSTLRELAFQGADLLPSRKFTNELAAYVQQAKRLAPARHERRALINYISAYSGLNVTKLTFSAARSEESLLSNLQLFLDWFRVHFPYDTGVCRKCGSDSSFVGCVRASTSERKLEAMRSELWQCSHCGNWDRFPRFNSVPKILQTRRGRCGEYSVVALQMLLSLGWRSRWVVDWEDHLWVEVWLPQTMIPHSRHGSWRDEEPTAPFPEHMRLGTHVTSKGCCSPQAFEQSLSVPDVAGGRWVHLDPCEAALDLPHLYSGWGKNHTFIVALGDGRIHDVTAKYAKNYAASVKRRCVSEAQVYRSIRRVTLTKGSPRLRPAVVTRAKLRHSTKEGHEGEAYGAIARADFMGQPLE